MVLLSNVIIQNFHEHAALRENKRTFFTKAFLS
jgi:hypothetical protein